LNTDSSLPGRLREAAAAACGQQDWPCALYVVATPIGNLADLSLRAIHALGLVDAIACEDTRVTATLLRHLGLHKPLIPLHAHNEAGAAPSVLARLAAGERVACVSDAGTPAISDPGARLVALAREAGHRVLPLPGASSVVTALSAAGDATAQGFRFAGFLPSKGADREQALARAAVDLDAVVLFEAPHRIAEALQALARLCPDRPLTVGRELTKQFEAFVTRRCAEMPGWLAESRDHARGEFVLVLHAMADGPGEPVLPAALSEALGQLVRALPVKQAVAIATALSGRPRNALYAQALALKDGLADPG
jgi:16S rRNA (cytidine1402-2'-O)-methyltransferase